MKGRHFSGLAAMALGLAAGMAGSLPGAASLLDGSHAGKATRADASKNAPGQLSSAQSLRGLFRGAGSGAPWRSGVPAKGWSVAEDRRRARKRRNQARNRKAHRA